MLAPPKIDRIFHNFSYGGLELAGKIERVQFPTVRAVSSQRPSLDLASTKEGKKLSPLASLQNVPVMGPVKPTDIRPISVSASLSKVKEDHRDIEEAKKKSKKNLHNEVRAHTKDLLDKERLLVGQKDMPSKKGPKQGQPHHEEWWEWNSWGNVNWPENWDNSWDNRWSNGSWSNN